MPQGKGTYGSKVGRPPKKKKIDPVKKKKATKKAAGAAKNASAKKAAAKKKRSGTQTGYGPQNRPGTFPKKRVVRGSDKKKSMAPTGNQGRKPRKKKKPVNTPSAPAGYSRRTRKNMAAKEALGKGFPRKKPKKGSAEDRMNERKGYMRDIATLRKGGKKKVVKKKVVKKKDNGGVKKGKVTKGKVSTKPQNTRQILLKKRADARDKKGKRKTLAQLRKEGKINF